MIQSLMLKRRLLEKVEASMVICPQAARLMALVVTVDIEVSMSMVSASIAAWASEHSPPCPRAALSLLNPLSTP
ncbi:UNVERIFIED_CONTAM: hypothetical protein K2H54_059020 [Gekko kuhli]